jgi:Domain of unknown function (DUF4129)
MAQRALNWLLTKLSKAFDLASRHSPGHGIGLLVTVLVVAVIVAAISVRVGRIRASVKAPAQPILGGAQQSPADHRQRAERFARDQQWAKAVREWLRATARELEERGVLDPRPGRTASELCAEAALRLPALASDLRQATAAFDAVWYGGRTAGVDDETLLRRLDQRVAGSHRSLRAKPTVEIGS